MHERDASDWQGTRHRYPEVEIDHAGIDLPLQAWLGRLTGHVSPAALAMAWFDWSTHLALSPNKQAELAFHAMSAGMRWLRYCAGSAFANVAGRSYQVATQAADAPYVDPDRWQSEAPLHEGSWWPQWEAWLAQKSGAWVAPRTGIPGLEPAPGRYVLEP